MDIKELLHRIHALIEEYLEIGSLATYSDLKRHNDNLQEENTSLSAKVVKLESDLSHSEEMIERFDNTCNNVIDTLKECMEGRI